LLEQQRGVRNKKHLPPFTVSQVLAWADAHHHRTGHWPRENSGAIVDAPGETWSSVVSALRSGGRGLPGNASLACVLAEHRRVRNSAALPNLTVTQILLWADAHHQRTGHWPTIESGAVAGAATPGETWRALDWALRAGGRDLRAGSSLACLLAEQRSVRNHKKLPSLTVAEILHWAETHRQRTGQWPTRGSGPIAEAPGETWSGVDAALHRGRRGLRRGLSLAGLLNQHHDLPPK
jgi:hypothetical protein